MEKFTCCIKEVFPTPLITPAQQAITHLEANKKEELAKDKFLYNGKDWQLADKEQRQILQSQLEQELEDIHQAHQQKRQQRSTEPEVATGEAKEQNKAWQQWQQDFNKIKPQSAFYAAHALARINPQYAIDKLLNHEIYTARQGAWRGLASLGDVELVKQMTKLRLEAHNNPIFHHALFRAIDLSLITIQVNGEQADLDALSDWMPRLEQWEANEENGENAISQRVDWTIGQLKYHLEIAMPELDRRYQVWLKKQKMAE